MAYPYSFANTPVADEASNHEWASLYNQGKYSLSLPEWFGVDAQKEFYVNSSGVHSLHLAHWWHDADGVGGRDDLSVNVSLDGLVPLAGVPVNVSPTQGWPSMAQATDVHGSALLRNLPRRDLLIAASYFLHQAGEPDLALREGEVLPYRFGLTPYLASISLSATSTTSVVRVSVHDHLAQPVAGARVVLVTKATPGAFRTMGTTNSAGELDVDPGSEGNFILKVQKEALRGGITEAALVRLGGEYRVVNVYPPGYAFLLGLSMSVGLEAWVTPVLHGLVTGVTYGLARRLYGWRVASIAAVLTTTCSLAVVMVYTRGMADYAAMAFPLVGLWLFYESAKAPSRSWRGSALAVAAGLAVGVALAMRYFVAPVAGGALLALVFLANGRLPRLTLGRLRARLPLALLGLAPPLALLALYSSAYLGGPLSIGYLHNMGVDLAPGGGTVPKETTVLDFIVENLNPLAALPSMGIRLLFVALAFPFLALLPWAFRRKPWHPGTAVLGAYFGINFLAFLFVPWVAAWGDLSRSLEDLRYFLPGIPAAATLAAHGLDSKGGTKGAALAVAVSAAMGLFLAKVTIDLILARPY